MSKNNQTSFFSLISEVAKIILDEVEENKQFLIASHFDADGLSAASILGKALIRTNASIHIKILEKLNKDIIDELSKIKADFLIFSDIGSGYFSILPEAIGSRKALVLDHHPPESIETIPDNILHINPHLHQIDGTTEISGSGISYFVAKSINEKNVDLSALAIVGALGDIQDKGDKHSLFSLNGKIVEDGVNANYVKVEKDLIFFGRETRPIHKAIAYTTNPFLPGLSGEEDKCLALLKSAEISLKDGDKWRSVVDLSQKEKQALLSKIIEYLSSKGFSGNVTLDLIGNAYTLLKEEKWTPSRDAREFASLLNACGRMRKSSLAVAFCLGERNGVAEDIKNILSEYRQTLANLMNLINENKDKVEDKGKVFVIHGEDIINENMTGAISTILSLSNQNIERVTLVLTNTQENTIKISGRASRLILDKGIHLGKILQILAEKYEGIGGGHDVAAGAEIPMENKTNFLKEFNEMISKQTGSD